MTLLTFGLVWPFSKKVKGAWTEEEDNELKTLYDEFQGREKTEENQGLCAINNNGYKKETLFYALDINVK